MPEPTTHTLRVAVVSSTVRSDPTDAAALRASGAEASALVRRAADAGARLVHLTEGALCFPDKRVVSATGPEEIGPADWSRADWPVWQEQLDALAALSAELGVWTVVPSVHPRPAPARPYNSVYVLSDRGTVAARYDERMLSTSKATWMYAAGAQPLTVDVDGFRLGFALGLDVLLPELFTGYDHLEVDAVLVSYATSGLTGNAHIGTRARGAAASHTCWVSLAVPADATSGLTSMVVDPVGEVVAEAPADGVPGLVLADLHRAEVIAAGRAFRRRSRERLPG
ncbi:carbon-nitrogen hydrolase family protein [Desertihabitans aurantiacus]|uniref:carbon-nitrogen hydrolase family protein n=1 Tax=Desertihabitans aurantiacus TaxID=2282477 RepID=UPI0018E4E8C1|nr:carbon-nitrogen hydrolase family protein [Desertihabitans aurantiacus]